MPLFREFLPNRKLIARELQKGTPLSKYDLSERCGITIRNINAYLKLMHEAGEIHLYAWHVISKYGSPTRFWLYGPGEDAPKPKPKTKAQSAREYRARYPEKVIADNIQKRIKRREERLST